VSNVKAVPMLLHLTFFFLFPLGLAPTLLPLGIDAGLRALGWIDWLPLALVLSLLECAAVIWFYRLALGWQGRWLQARERAILEAVAGRAQ
jgi:hypothetical protein